MWVDFDNNFKGVTSIEFGLYWIIGGVVAVTVVVGVFQRK